MPTIHLESQVSPEDLIRAADRLSPPELERVVAQIITLLAHRRAPSLSPAETRAGHHP